jgi:hypothetical protein
MPDITYAGETFEGFNKPKRTPRHPTKSHAVLAKVGDKIKLVRFGQQGVSGSPYRKGEPKASRDRRRNWMKRHEANIAKGPLFPAYWSARVKW